MFQAKQLFDGNTGPVAAETKLIGPVFYSEQACWDWIGSRPGDWGFYHPDMTWQEAKEYMASHNWKDPGFVYHRVDYDVVPVRYVTITEEIED